MAERRMFSKTLIESDRFLELPDKAKLLYFYLVMNADDDGFIGNTKSIIRAHGYNKTTLESLIESGYVMRISENITVIRHWRMQNKVRSDRYVPTVYTEEREQLLTDNQGVYRM